MHFLGIDLGTTGCKSILFKNDGAIAGEAYVEYPLIHTAEGYVEQDADLWWSLVKRVVRDTVAAAGVLALAVRREPLLLIDGRPSPPRGLTQHVRDPRRLIVAVVGRVIPGELLHADEIRIHFRDRLHRGIESVLARAVQAMLDVECHDPELGIGAAW